MMKIGKRNIRLRFFIIFLLIILISSYGIYSVFLKSKTFILHTGTIEEFQNGKVVILRDESVVYTEEVGKINYLVSEGESVAKGSPILELYKLGFDENLLKELNEIQIKIKNYQQENILKNIIDNNLNQINDQIDAHTMEILQYIKNNELNKLQIVERQIKSLMTARLNYLKETIKPDDYLSKLYEKEKEANIRIQTYKTVLRAEDAGIISFYFDGDENLFNMGNLNQLSVNDVKNAISSINPIDTTETKAQRSIYRIVNKSKWYLLLADTSNMEFLSNNEYLIKFDIDPNQAHKGKIIKTNITEKNNLVVIEMMENIGSLVSDRILDVTLSRKASGFIVPLKAIENHGLQKGVFITNQSFSSFVTIKILSQNKEYAVIKEVGTGKLLAQGALIVLK